MKCVPVAGVFAVLIAGWAPAGPKPAPSPRADALDLLVLAGEQPARLELRVAVDGKPVTAVWDETFARLHAFFDRDNSGTLSKTEAARLPSAFALRQVLWGQVTPVSGDPPAFGDLDLDGDGAVAGDELADYYRRCGLGNVLVGVGTPAATDRLTDALLKTLDADGSGTVEEVEWKAAADALRGLDANDDELIGPGELVGRVAYPGALGSNLLPAPEPGRKPDPLARSLLLVVLPLRTADTHWAAAVADRLPMAASNRDVSVLRSATPAASWQVHFTGGTEPGAALEPVGGKPPATARLTFAAGPVRLELRADTGKLRDQTAAARKRFRQLFAEADANADGKLDPGELAAPKATLLKPLLAVADRNGDGHLGEAEFAAWLDLQDQIARGHVLLTVLDHGAGLFEVLDADRDGSLSVRELRGAWDGLRAAGCVSDGRFDRAKLPRHLLAAVSHGHPRTPLGVPVRSGPAWFRAMDRNGDGDVSRREFTGPADLFGKLDRDGDGLLDAAEAARAPGR